MLNFCDFIYQRHEKNELNLDSNNEVNVNYYKFNGYHEIKGHIFTDLYK